MSKRRAIILAFILGFWLLFVLPMWMIGLGYEAHGFRVPMYGRDALLDILLFYVPIVAALSMLVRPMADRFRR